MLILEGSEIKFKSTEMAFLCSLIKSPEGTHYEIFCTRYYKILSFGEEIMWLCINDVVLILQISFKANG